MIYLYLCKGINPVIEVLSPYIIVIFWTTAAKVNLKKKTYLIEV